MLEIHIIKALTDNYIYLLRNKEKNITSVIDPGESKPVINFLNDKGWKLDQIINTHHHHDHIGGNSELLNIYKSKLIAPSYDKERILNADIYASDNEEISIAGINTKVIFTPGHTLGHICLYMEEEKCLFSGDTLFYLGCGRVFEGTMKQMWQSLLKLRSLPDETMVYCGHEYTMSNANFCNYIDPNNKLLKKVYPKIKENSEKSLPSIPFKLGMDKQTNPFLRADQLEFLKSINMEGTDPVNVFKEIRLQKNNF